MKYLLTCLALLVGTHSQAKNIDFDIKIHPVAFMVGVVNLEAEFFINDNIGLSPAFYYYNIDDEDINESITFKDIGLNVNYYFSGHEGSSGYLTPFIHTLTVDGEGEFWDLNDEGHSITSIGLSTGYRWKLDSNIVVAGEFGYASVFSEASSGSLTPVLTFTVGYSF